MARTKIPRICQNCGQEFVSKNTKLELQRNAKFCSQACYRVARPAEPIEIRFWRRVDKSADCWVWTGCVDNRGYGQISTGKTGKHIKTHRLAWELENGSIPEGLCVCHKCDNPPCVRPDHLFLGSKADNNRDMKRKGRQAFGDRAPSRRNPERYPRGTGHHYAKLNESIVRDIRSRYRQGQATEFALAHEYGVSVGCVSGIVNRKSWKHIP